MSKVYITQDNNKNYTASHGFGDPEFITDLEYSSVANSKRNENILEQVKQTSFVYDPEVDFILLSGDPVIIGLVMHQLLKEHGRINLLKWDNQERKYAPLTISE